MEEKDHELEADGLEGPLLVLNVHDTIKQCRSTAHNDMHKPNQLCSIYL